MNATIQQKITTLDKHFKSTNTDFSERERVFSRVIKLNEEVGELCEAVLAELDKNQREKDRSISVDDELADVMICALLLAEQRNVPLWKNVEEKLTKILDKVASS